MKKRQALCVSSQECKMLGGSTFAWQCVSFNGKSCKAGATSTKEEARLERQLRDETERSTF